MIPFFQKSGFVNFLKKVGDGRIDGLTNFISYDPSVNGVPKKTTEYPLSPSRKKLIFDLRQGRCRTGFQKGQSQSFQGLRPISAAGGGPKSILRF